MKIHSLSKTRLFERSPLGSRPHAYCFGSGASSAFTPFQTSSTPLDGTVDVSRQRNSAPVLLNGQDPVYTDVLICATSGTSDGLAVVFVLITLIDLGKNLDARSTLANPQFEY
jgi:hypothetical protein